VTDVKPKSDEKMLPLLRASVASRLLQRGFRVNQIARALNVTPSAVTQYANGARGKKQPETERQQRITDALAEKGTQRINGNMESLSALELLDAAHQIIAVTRGEMILGSSSEGGKENESVMTLKGRFNSN
jgi:predicted transcriptional regulator